MSFFYYTAKIQTFFNRAAGFLKKVYSLSFTGSSALTWQLLQIKTLFHFSCYFFLDKKVTKKSSAIQCSAATVWRGPVL